ncbi:MAG: biopolymer transporter ExbD [Roseivirga sp.]|nr:biopolymer transporter ExbD [Roseivirga sp.]
MDIKSKHEVNANFSMSSMTDIVFLLLIFFMLTSSFITPSGLPVNLPSAAVGNIVSQSNSVTITADLKYYLNDNEVSINNLERELAKVATEINGSVAIHVDESVDTKHLVKVAGIAMKLKQKLTIVTKPE